MTTYYPPPCMDLSGVLPGKPPISVHRIHGAGSMPMREGVLVTTYLSDYIPPVLMPGYQGHVPTVGKMSIGNTYGGDTIKYFKQYRSQELNNSARPKFIYGRLPAAFTPFPDVAVAEQSIPWKKLADRPLIRPITYDRQRMDDIEKFHEDCVNHRDYYLDRTETLYPNPFFNLGSPYPYKCPVDERVFKIRRATDYCDAPGYVGPPLNCRAMPCIRARGFLTPFDIPKLPRDPFICSRVKPKDPRVHEVLLV